MSEENYNPKITIEYDIRQKTDIEFCLHDVLSAINELPVTSKWNIIAGILRNLNPETDCLTSEQKELIKSFLIKQQNRF